MGFGIDAYVIRNPKIVRFHANDWILTHTLPNILGLEQWKIDGIESLGLGIPTIIIIFYFQRTAQITQGLQQSTCSMSVSRPGLPEKPQLISAGRPSNPWHGQSGVWMASKLLTWLSCVTLWTLRCSFSVVRLQLSILWSNRFTYLSLCFICFSWLTPWPSLDLIL